MPNRNWAIWHARRTTNATLEALGREYGVSKARVQQLVRARDKVLIRGLTRALDAPGGPRTGPREAILGVEFVFTHEILAEGPGWDTLATGTEWDEQSWSHVPTYAHCLDEGIVYRVKKVSEGD